MANDIRKAELTGQLAVARTRLSAALHELQRDLDVRAHVTSSFRHHKTAWLGGAAVAGWILSRLPARKKKVYVDRKDKQKITSQKEAGLLLVVGKLIFSALRPAITAFATKKIADLAMRGGPPQNRWGREKSR